MMVKDLAVTDASDLAEFRHLLEGERLYCAYQPVVELRTARIFGWEALLRGPKGSSFQNPLSLIDFADRHGHSWALERAARACAFRGVGTLPPAAKLLINVNPYTMADPEFRAGQTRRLAQANSICLEDVIIEITERTSIEDFGSFRRLIQHYREQGYRIAIDDVGEGYAGLRAVAELRPDYLKVDMSLVQGCHNDSVKQAIIKALVSVADTIGSRIIAEGIEAAEDLRTLLHLGVHFGQGYLLARPHYPRPGLSPEVTCMLESLQNG